MSQQKSRYFVVVALILLTGCSSALPLGATPSTPQTSPASSQIPGSDNATRIGVVIEVTDGDTVDVRFSNGEVATIRLLGVDTPETAEKYMNPSEYSIPNTAHGRDWLLTWGHRAQEFAHRKLADERVYVVFDSTSDKRGYYGRLLASIYYGDGQNFGTQLLERGLARAYSGGDFSRENKYRHLESRAQRQNRGLWGFNKTKKKSPENTDGNHGSLPTPPADGDYDCSDFDSQSQAQHVLENSPDANYHLDGNGDGEACESLS